MNLWVVKLGGAKLTAEEIGKVKDIADGYQTLENRDITQFKNKHIHYLSFTTAHEFGGKRYNLLNEQKLIAFSGLPVSRKSMHCDFRDVANLKHYVNNYEATNSELLGQYALIKASVDEFECFTDFLGIHKVFYSQLSNGEILISNSVPCIQNVAGSELNYDFYVNWIAFGGIYGYDTEDIKVKALPEFGHLMWSASNGLKVNRRCEVSSLILPDQDLDYYIDQTVSDFKNSIHYLTEFHESILPLSGGYDSRLILEAFTLFNTSGLRLYTYPDKPEDVIYAKQLASYYKLNHELLKPEKKVNEIDVNDSMFFPGDVFRDYNKVFGFQFREQKLKYSKDSLKVLLKGDGGDTQAGFRKYSSSNDNNIEEAIKFIVEKSVIKGLLNKEAEELFKDKMETYYRDKYLEVVKQSGSTYNLANIYYLIERFGNYQSHKLINGYQLNDIYLPYASQNFIKAVFLSSKGQLLKNKKQSLHHIIHRKILGSKSKTIHFDGGIHWDANKLQRIIYRIRKKFKETFKQTEGKHSSTVRDQFFENNIDWYREIILSSNNHELWNYFEYNRLKEALVNNNVNSKQKKAISRIVPLLLRKS